MLMRKEKIFRIDKFLGLNEAPDGDTGLKFGEAADMRNFKITPEGNLQLRPGTFTVCTISAGNPVRGMWHGYVDGIERLVTACNGHVYSHDLTTFAKTDLGTLTDASTHFFGFNSKLYILNGHEYKYWDGTTFDDVTGYIPITYIACAPTGGGTPLEQVNKLIASKTQWFSSTGSADTYQLAETEIASVDAVYLNGTLKTETTHYTVNLTNGTVTFLSTPSEGTNDVKITYTGASSDRATIVAQMYSELYNGQTDNRIFLYGDGTNKAYYSGIPYTTGIASAEYFPDLNVLDVGTTNTPITSLVRHFNKLMAFKTDSTYLIDYDYITLEDDTTTAAFCTKAIDKNTGNEPAGQVQLVNNYPISIQGKAAYRWSLIYSSGTQDERSAKLISSRVANALSNFTTSSVKTFDDEYNREFWIVDTATDTALVYSYANETDYDRSYKNNLWYKYTNIPAECFVNVGGEVYFGTDDGYLMHFSRDYHSDNGAEIDAHWESGSMNFDAEYLRKFIRQHFISMKPEASGRIVLTLSTDRKTDFASKTVTSVRSGLSTFSHANFAAWSFGTNRRPQVIRIKLKAKKFTHLKLIISSYSTTSTATVLMYSIPVAYTGYAK